MQRLSSLFLVLFLLSCESSFDSKKMGSFKVMLPSRSDKEIEVPKELISVIESKFLKHIHRFKPDGLESDAKLLATIPRKFLGIDIFFRPNTNLLAFDRKYQYNFPRGGGVIDLSDFVEGGSGSFRLNMLLNFSELGIENSGYSDFSVYFMSNSRRREILGKSFGSGCGKYMDVTGFFRSKFETTGLKLYATDQRYLSVIAGTFYFVLFREGALHLATASFEDTRYPGLHCRI